MFTKLSEYFHYPINRLMLQVKLRELIVAAMSSAKHKIVGESRVGKGITAQASRRTVREPLDSYGSCYPVMILFQVSSDKTVLHFRSVLFCILHKLIYNFEACICSSTIFLSVHLNNKIHRAPHVC